MKFKFKNLDLLITQIADLSNVMVVLNESKKALDKGSGVVADETRKQLKNLPVDDRKWVDGERTGLRTIQKQAIINGFGVSPIQQNNKDKINRKTGVNRDVNKLNEPNVVVARRLENGTSYMRKDPVFSRASRKARKECLKAMENSLNDSINKLWNRH